MNELIERLAREAGIIGEHDIVVHQWCAPLERFAALVAHECARLCEGYQDPNDGAVMADELRAAFPMPKG